MTCAHVHKVLNQSLHEDLAHMGLYHGVGILVLICNSVDKEL